MKRSYMIAASVGAAAVLGVTGTALAAADSSGGPSPSAGPSEVFRGDGTVDDNATPSELSSASPSGSPSASPSGSPSALPSGSPSALPFETAEPGSVTPSARSGLSDAPTTGLGSAAANAANVVSIEWAKARALSVVGGGRVTKVEAETEHGRAIWEIEVVRDGVEHDLDIDRATGAVTDHDTDRDGDSGRNDKSGRDGSGSSGSSGSGGSGNGSSGSSGSSGSGNGSSGSSGNGSSGSKGSGSRSSGGGSSGRDSSGRDDNSGRDGSSGRDSSGRDDDSGRRGGDDGGHGSDD